MTATARSVLLLVSVVFIAAVLLVWSKCSLNNKPITQSEKSRIGETVSSLDYLTGTNIIGIERIAAKRVRVRTRAESGSGGDLLELQETNGKWVLERRGAWLK